MNADAGQAGAICAANCRRRRRGSRTACATDGWSHRGRHARRCTCPRSGRQPSPDRRRRPTSCAAQPHQHGATLRGFARMHRRPPPHWPVSRPVPDRSAQHLDVTAAHEGAAVHQMLHERAVDHGQTLRLTPDGGSGKVDLEIHLELMRWLQRGARGVLDQLHPLENAQTLRCSACSAIPAARYGARTARHYRP